MATARPASPTTTEPSDNECSVCNELFTVPKLLPCGHVLCRHCLVTWLQSQPQAQCPLCRCPVLEPVKAAAASTNWNSMPYLAFVQPRQGPWSQGQATAASNNWDVVADGFPTDLAMEELVEAERLLNKDHQCCFCEDATATCLCLDCNDLFCASCKNGHTNQKMSRHHSVQDLTSLTADKLASHRPSPCPAHADKACELYCPSHDTSMCTVCFASRHRSCPDVTDLQHKADESRAVLQQLAIRLAQAEKKLDQGLSELEELLHDKEKKSKASLAELKAACDRLKSAIDAYYIRVEQEVEEDRSDVSKKVNDNKACLSQQRGRVTSESSIVDRVQGIKKHDAIITMTSVMAKRIDNLDLSGTFSNSIKIVGHKILLVNEGIEKQILQQLPNVGKFVIQLSKPGTSGAQRPYQSNMPVSQPLISDKSAAQPNPWSMIPAQQNPCSITLDQLFPLNKLLAKPKSSNTFAYQRTGLGTYSANEDQNWFFHDNHGENIVLSSCAKTAERRGRDDGGGIVLGNNPMAVDYLYEVKLLSSGQAPEDYMFVGVVSGNCPDIIQLPHTNFCYYDWGGAVVIRPSTVHILGKQTKNEVGANMRCLPRNSRLGVSLDRYGDLHLYVNGQDQGVVASDMEDYCWPMFELYGPYRKITALPVTIVKNQNGAYANRHGHSWY